MHDPHPEPKPMTLMCSECAGGLYTAGLQGAVAGPLLLSLAAMLLRLRAEFCTAAASAIAAGGAGDGPGGIPSRSRGGSAAPSRAHSRAASPEVHWAGRNPGRVAPRAGARRARSCSAERGRERGSADQDMRPLQNPDAELPRHQRM